MPKWFVIFDRNMRKWLRDRRSLMWALVVPLAIFLMGAVFGGAITGNQIIIFRESHGPFSDMLIGSIDQLKSSDDPIFKIGYMEDLESAQRQIELGHAQAVLYIPEDFDRNLTLRENALLLLKIDNSNPLVSREISSILLELTSKMNVNLQIDPVFEKQFDYIHFFASAAPVIIASMSAYQATGMPIVQDKEKGVWKRYLVTPVSNWDLVMGDVISGTIKAMVASTLAYVITVFLIGYNYIGAEGVLNGFFFILISVVGWVGTSILVASRVNYNSYFSLGMLMNLLIFSTSGMFYPVEGLPLWLRIVSYINPLTYIVEAFRGIMLRRLTILDLGTNFFFLLLFSVAMILVGVLSYRRRIE